MTTLRIAFVVLVALAITGFLVHIWIRSAFERETRAAMQRVLTGGDMGPQRAVNLATIPEIVRRFAARAGVSTAPPSTGVYYRQAVEFRPGPDKPWGPLSAEQTTSFTEPGFVWYAEQRRGPLTFARIVDAFVAGKGFLQVRLLGSIPVANFGGPQAAHDELMRYLAELPWAPDAIWHNPDLRWHDLGDNVVEVAADSIGGVARVRLYFNGDGDIVEMQAEARGSTENGVVVRRPWRGVFSDYRDIGGRRIPRHGEVGYLYADGYAPYFRGKIIDYRIE